MVDMTSEVFYEKLFSAMEAEHPKGERTLLGKMSDHFGLGSEKDVRSALVRSVQPEKVMVWLLAEAAPFVKMLDEIYHLLADVKATIFGRADQFSFLFEKINKRVSFPLDSFPKTYVRALTDVEVLTTRFTPGARGHLMIDTPNYWRDDVPALSNLSRSPVLNENSFGPLPREYQQAIRSRVRTALKVLEANYVAFDVPDNFDEGYLRQYKRLYFADQALFESVLRLAEENRGSKIGSYYFSNEVSEFVRERQDEGTVVSADSLMKCLLFADERLGDRSPTEAEQLDFPDEGLDSNLTYAFIKAYDLCFRAAPRTIRDYAEFIDKVFLPFYRDRWLLFEIWAILWVRNIVPASRRPSPLLTPRDDDLHSSEWVIPGGDARAPVAAWTGDSKTVELWYQQKTPLTPEQAAKFGQNNIEPDVRVRSGIVDDTSDLAILELKDRFNASGSKEKKIARMYATTDARLVCVANYSEFRPRYLRGQVYKEMADGGTEILIVGDFRPGQIPTEVSEAFERAFAKGGRGLPTQFDLIGDISISMPVEARSRTIQALATAGLTPARVFAFDTDLKELPSKATADWPKGGATDLPAALRKYLQTEGRAPSGKALILTDDDGVKQFRHVLEMKEFDMLDLRCFDVTEELEGNDLAEWADG
jgi:hypothetical protein